MKESDSLRVALFSEQSMRISYDIDMNDTLEDIANRLVGFTFLQV